MEPNWLAMPSFLAGLNVAYPGLHLIRRDGLAAAMDAPQTAYFYGGRTNVVWLGALYAERIAKAHAFADGNKRAAALSCVTFLQMNKITTFIPADAFASAVENLAACTRTVDDFEQFLLAYIAYRA